MTSNRAGVDYTRKWTSGEKFTLMELKRRGRSWNAIGEHLGRSPEACRHRHRTDIANVAKGVRTTLHVKWQQSEIDQLVEMRKTRSCPQIARALNRSKYAVWHKTKQLGKENHAPDHHAEGIHPA